MAARPDDLIDWQTQDRIKREQALERKRMFESHEMTYGDTWPPFTDCTSQAIESEQRLIENYDRSIAVFQQMIGGLA